MTTVTWFSTIARCSSCLSNCLTIWIICVLRWCSSKLLNLALCFCNFLRFGGETFFLLFTCFLSNSFFSISIFDNDFAIFFDDLIVHLVKRFSINLDRNDLSVFSNFIGLCCYFRYLRKTTIGKQFFSICSCFR